jgi:hypothetical protein
MYLAPFVDTLYRLLVPLFSMSYHYFNKQCYYQNNRHDRALCPEQHLVKARDCSLRHLTTRAALTLLALCHLNGKIKNKLIKNDTFELYDCKLYVYNFMLNNIHVIILILDVM